MYINATNFKSFKNNNKLLYIIETNGINEFSFIIKGKENSAYSVGYTSKLLNFDNSDQYIVLNGGNYLFNLENRTDSDIILYNIYEFNDILPNYIGFFPLTCMISILNVIVNASDYSPIYKNIMEKKGFYQEIYTKDDINIPNTFHFGYKISKNEIDNESCLFYVSLCRIYDQNTTDFINGIILADNIPQLFMFNQKYNVMKFIYLHAQNENIIKINIKLLDVGEYKILLSFDDEKYEKEYNIKSNQSISIKPMEWNDLCIKDEKQLCKLSFFVISKK